MAVDVDQTWGKVTKSLCTTGEDVAIEVKDLELLHQYGLTQVLQTWFYEMLQQHLSSQVAPQFWSHFQKPVPLEKVLGHIKEVFSWLHADISKFGPCICRLGQVQTYIASVTGNPACWQETVAKQQLTFYTKAIVFQKTVRHFQEAMFRFYFQAFKAFDASTKCATDMDDSEVDDDVESQKCDGCDADKDSCQCAEIMSTFHDLNQQLRDLGLLDRLSGEAVSTLIYQRIQLHVQHSCKGNFETQFLDELEQWLESKVVGWLELIYGGQGKPASTSSSGGLQLVDTASLINSHKGRLYHFMYEIYAKIRIQQLFNVIIEFPESEPALLDLKACLEKTNLRGPLVKSLKNALETRLLHPGVNTSDILTAYTNAIRALRVLDPSGVLLDLVCEPVRRYLRNRDDTVRCIVSSLTDDGNSELSDELVKGQPLVLDESYISDDEADDWENWNPDPVDADPLKSSSSRRSSDIISMLVNIYGSKELFVNEYRTLLADRILAYFNYDTEKEIRYLELLKLRFGESQLHYCEVMLKDVADSKRINTHMMEQRERARQEGRPLQDNEKIPVNAMILSAEFWPAFREEKVEMPEFLQKHLEKYTTHFEALKGNRTLNWKPHLGQMNVEIELKDKTLDLTVSPVHATIIWHFQEKVKWTIEELSAAMHMPTQALRRKLAFWQSHGLLKEDTPDLFVLVEEVKGRNHETMVMEEEEAESAMASAQDQKEEELQVIWSYIVGMLTNLDSMPLERIHSMLKMFAMAGPGSECSIEELKAFLDRKVKEQKLIFTAGVYRLAKAGS